MAGLVKQRRGRWKAALGRSHLPDLDEVEVASALAHPASLAEWLSHGDPSCWWSRISPNAVWSRFSPMPADAPSWTPMLYRIRSAGLRRPAVFLGWIGLKLGSQPGGRDDPMKVVCEKETCRRLKSSESRGFGLPDNLRKTLYYQSLEIHSAGGQFALS